jgi:mono/diheme cytochrome c family protein
MDMRLAVVLVLGLAIGGCKKTSEPPDEGGATPKIEGGGSAAPAQSKAAIEARRVFQSICATCHGPGGKGDGQAAMALNPKPRNYTDKSWQASVTDDDIRKIILNGGGAVGKSPTMPAQPQLANQPEVVDELVKIIRGFAK